MCASVKRLEVPEEGAELYYNYDKLSLGVVGYHEYDSG